MEILVALIAVSCISAALAPVITKKLKSNAVSIGGGGIGGKTEDVEFVMDCSDFGTDCTMCFNDKCVLCTKECNDDQYVNTPDCTCADCTDVDPNCIECTSKKCRKCAENYGLNLSTKKCYLCTNGQSSDGMSECANCPENYFCVDGNKTPCASNQFAPANSTSCTNCADKWEHCIKCNPRECLECEPLYRKKEDGTCMMSTQSKVFTTPGNHTFEVPGGVSEIEVTLVSGGAGGGAGSTVQKTQTIVISGNGGVTADGNNYVNTTSTGVWTWTLPNLVKGKYFKYTACGGGGGGGGEGGCSGGNGGYLQNAILSLNVDTIPIQIGGGGGGGSNDDGGTGQSGACALGGGGGGSFYENGGGGNSSSCGADSTYGRGGNGNLNSWYGGTGGYDPLYSSHQAGGGTGGGGGSYGAAGGNGSRLGGGGGGGSDKGGGGGGGAATLFRHTSYANSSSYVAPGGGGGGGSGSGGGGGGGGGGVNGGAGGKGNCVSGTAGKGGTSGANTIFGASYCSGGGSNSTGKNGAMRIWYVDIGTTGGTGGGAGQIVPKQRIQVTPGDILTITVGEGATGGTAGNMNSSGVISGSTNGNGANTSIISKITDGSGVTLITSATNATGAGTTGGNPDGTTIGEKGYITTGRNTSQITVEGFSNTDGEVANTTTGGSGGKTTLEGAEMHCSPGAGGTSGNAGGDATGYGGCGGGGGGAGANGGKGAGGYVKITYGT